MLDLAIGLVMAMQAAAAPSERWTPVASGCNERLFVDLETAGRDGNYVLVWERLDFSRPEQDGIVRMLTRVRYDCRARTSDILYVRHLRADGSVVAGVEVADNQRQVEPVDPDSLVAGAFRVVCGR